MWLRILIHCTWCICVCFCSFGVCVSVFSETGGNYLYDSAGNSTLFMDLSGTTLFVPITATPIVCKAPLVVPADAPCPLSLTPLKAVALTQGSDGASLSGPVYTGIVNGGFATAGAMSGAFWALRTSIFSGTTGVFVYGPETWVGNAGQVNVLAWNNGYNLYFMCYANK